MGGILVAVVVILVIAIAAQLLFQVAGLVWMVIAWMLAGMLAGRLLRGRGYGPVMDVVLGLAGGVVGTLALSLLHLGWVNDVWIVGNILVGIVGAIILIYILRLLGNRDFGR
jgi:uncharacterized membrane protein YeaQ/YmgE (transglycosylase-associated protein family)